MRKIVIAFILFSYILIIGCKKDLPENNSLPTTGKTGTFTDNRDNKTYKWVEIGSQTWMAENLNFVEDNAFQHSSQSFASWFEQDINGFPDGDSNGWCYYDNNISNGAVYGALYQWNAAKEACPVGWHLPSKDEWGQLEDYLIENKFSFEGTNTNEIAKSLGTDYGWKANDFRGTIGNTDFQEYRNLSGFSALAAGRREAEDFHAEKFDAVWWTSDTLNNTSSAYIRSLGSGSSMGIHKDIVAFYYGYSVRCVKD